MSVAPNFIEILLYFLRNAPDNFLIGSRRFESSRFAEVYSAQENEQDGPHEMQAG